MISLDSINLKQTCQALRVIPLWFSKSITRTMLMRTTIETSTRIWRPRKRDSWKRPIGMTCFSGTSSAFLTAGALYPWLLTFVRLLAAFTQSLGRRILTFKVLTPTWALDVCLLGGRCWDTCWRRRPTSRCWHPLSSLHRMLEEHLFRWSLSSLVTPSSAWPSSGSLADSPTSQSLATLSLL